MRYLKLLATLLLAGGCRTEGISSKQETAGAPTSPTERESAKMNDDDAIAVARKEAENRGNTTTGLDVSVKHVDGIWEVSFYKITPGVRGGDGFMVRLRDPGGNFIDLRRFQ